MMDRKLNLLVLVCSMMAATLMSVTAFAQDQEPEVDLCDDLYACLSDCDEADGACQEDCVASAEPAVQEAYLDAIACFLGSECAEDDDDCIVEACAEEAVALDAACSGEQPDIACFDFLACAGSCDPEGDTDAYLDCLLVCADGVEDEEERAVISEAFACVQDSGCELDDEDCVEDACGEEGDAFTDFCELDEGGEDPPDEENNGEEPDEINGGNNDTAGGDNNGEDSGAANNDANNDEGAANNDGGAAGGDTEADAEGGDSDDDSGCSVAPGQGGAGGTAMLLLLGLVALGLRRREA
jgi:MYXO-CTERM domain-containing protein